MRVLELHPWRVSYREAVGIQNSLRERLRLEPLARPLRLVAGADVAYPRLSRRTCPGGSTANRKAGAK